MDLLTDIRNLFARKPKPGDEADAPLGLRNIDAEPVSPSSLASDRRPLRLRPANELSTSEMLGAIAQLSDRVADHTRATQQLLEQVRSMPETAQRSGELLKMIQQRLDQTDTRRVAVETSLADLRHTIDRQASIHAMFEEQLTSHGQSSDRVTRAVDSLTPALADISAAGKRITDRLTEISREAIERHESLIKAAASRDKWLMIAAGLSALAAAAAIVTLILVLTRAA